MNALLEDQNTILNILIVYNLWENWISIQKTTTKKSAGPDGFTDELVLQNIYERTDISSSLTYKKTEEEGTLLNSPYEMSFTLIPKPTKYHKKNIEYISSK